MDFNVNTTNLWLPEDVLIFEPKMVQNQFQYEDLSCHTFTSGEKYYLLRVLVTQPEATIDMIAKRHKIKANTLYGWKKREAQGKYLFSSSKGTPSPLDEISIKAIRDYVE